VFRQPGLYPVHAHGAYYSGPHRLLGERLWVRAAGHKIELFHEHALIATHRRARPGQRRTVLAHLPPEKVHFLMQTPTWCRTRAAEVGPACGLFIDALLGDRPLDRLRSAQGVLRFVDRYGADRVEAACARAHAVGEYRYHTIKAILVHALAYLAAPRAALDHLLSRPPSGRQEVIRIDLIHQLTPMLRTLRLSGILETLDVRNRQAVEQQSSFVEFLTTLLQDEVERRAQSKLRLRLRRAAFDPSKTLEGFDFSFNPKLNKAQVFDLATCQFIARHESVLVYGPTGVGKSHLAQALAHEACRRGHEVLFVNTDKMLAHLAGGRADGTPRIPPRALYPSRSAGARRLRAQSPGPPGPKDLYDVVNERYERGSILLTSNRDRAEWPDLFGEPLLASAALDRLTHGAHFVEITGQSFRGDYVRVRDPVTSPHWLHMGDLGWLSMGGR
jgi:DNA replication protein DnaC